MKILYDNKEFDTIGEVATYISKSGLGAMQFLSDNLGEDYAETVADIFEETLAYEPCDRATIEATLKNYIYGILSEQILGDGNI